MSDYSPLLEILTALATLIGGIYETRRQWKKDPAAVIYSAKVMAVYVAYAAVGIAIAVYLVDGPQPSDKALGLTAFILLWIGYGALWLVRTVPRETALPRWIGSRFNFVDATMIVGALIGLGVFFR